MKVYIIGLLIVIILYIFLYRARREHFENYNYDNDNYKNNLLTYKPKKDVYMNFLGDLNDSFTEYVNKTNEKTGYSIKQKLLCDDRVKIELQNKALNDAFSRVEQTDISKESDVFVKDVDVTDVDVKIDFVESTNRDCAYKANHLCKLTNPMLYLSERSYFPSRWIGPYKNVPLPKHTDLKCWDNMSNCCKNNF